MTGGFLPAYLNTTASEVLAPLRSPLWRFLFMKWLPEKVAHSNRAIPKKLAIPGAKLGQL